MWWIRFKVNTLESRERLRGLVRSCRNIKLYITYLYKLEARTIFVRDGQHPFGTHIKQPDHWMIVSDHELSQEENAFIYKVASNQ
jgi:hypothetical protein